MRRALGVLLWLLDQTVPVGRCALEHTRNQRRVRDGADKPLGDDKVYLVLESADLKESHRAALSLRDQLQRRAQGYLMAVTVASSFSLGALALLTKLPGGAAGPPHLSVFTRVILFAVMASFLMSALCALLALAPSEVYDVWLRSQLPKDPNLQKSNLIRFTQLNESYALAYGYHVRGSYVGMRNGAVLLMVWFTAVLVAPACVF